MVFVLGVSPIPFRLAEQQPGRISDVVCRAGLLTLVAFLVLSSD
jgi:hypothetical protein